MCWSLHIPNGLNSASAGHGARYRQVVQAPDLMPTLLDLCGVDLPEAAEVEGRSLAPVLHGETKDGPRDVSITTWTLETHHGLGTLYCRRPTVTDGEWTLLLSGPPDPEPPKLYHVADDEEEQDNVWPEHREEAQRLHWRMIAWLRDHGARASTLDRLSAANVGLG